MWVIPLHEIWTIPKINKILNSNNFIKNMVPKNLTKDLKVSLCVI